ncbi:hypothetical protein [Pseudonocardia nigra]|uniref:hypothetical protein n=1 Tax=Pseudonocardia nigra TaxID=1921578 RepID=UPI001C5F2A19|nr:hypothetical protein [Pseudonocardia nigra]
MMLGAGLVAAGWFSAILMMKGSLGPIEQDAVARETLPSTVARSSSPPSRVAPTPTSIPDSSIPKQVYHGAGTDVVDLTTPVEVGVLAFDCPRCGDRAEVTTNAGIDEQVISHFTGGPYSGMRWLGMRGGVTSRVQVKAEGPWTLTIGGLDLAARYDGAQPVSGTGDAVVLLETAPDTVDVSHSGESNFTVKLMTDRHRTGPDLVVNEIGKFRGTVFFDVSGTDAALVEVGADGAWTLVPQR